MKDLIRYRKKSARKILYVFLALTLIMVFINGSTFGQVYHIIRGINAPLVTTSAELEEALDTKGYATFEAMYLDDSGVYYEMNGRTTDNYMVSSLEDFLVVVVEKGDASSIREFDHYDDPSGQTERVTVRRPTDRYHYQGFDLIIEDYATAFDSTEDEVSGYFHPEVVELTEFRSNLYPGIGVTLGTLVMGILIYVFLSHKAVNDIEKNFSYEELDLLASQTENPAVNNKHFIVTESYLIRKSGINIKKQIIRLVDIAWVYRKVTTHRTNGIKTGTSHSIMIYTDTLKGPVEIPASESEFIIFIDSLVLRHPDVIVGFDNRFLKVWNQSKSLVRFRERLTTDLGIHFSQKEVEDEVTSEATDQSVSDETTTTDESRDVEATPTETE